MTLVPDPRLLRVFEQLRAARFADLKGARVTVSCPVPERLLNEFVQALLPPSAPVREVTVRPQASNRLAVRARISRVDFLPPVTVTLEIEQQPRLPDTPLVLRILSLPGLLSLAGSAMPMATVLPAGIRLEKDRVVVDVRMLLERGGYGDVAELVEHLHVATADGRLLIDAALGV